MLPANDQNFGEPTFRTLKNQRPIFWRTNVQDSEEPTTKILVKYPDQCCRRMTKILANQRPKFWRMKATFGEPTTNFLVKYPDQNFGE